MQDVKLEGRIRPQRLVDACAVIQSVSSEPLDEEIAFFLRFCDQDSYPASSMSLRWDTQLTDCVYSTF